MTKADIEHYDCIVAMEKYNLKNISRMLGEDACARITLMMDYTDRPGDVSDPWYTGDFDRAYTDIEEGCV